MLRKRPCRICRRWFQPHARAGERQRVCSEAACQRDASVATTSRRARRCSTTPRRTSRSLPITDAVTANQMLALGERFGFVFEAHAVGDANRSARVDRPLSLPPSGGHLSKRKERSPDGKNQENSRI